MVQKKDIWKFFAVLKDEPIAKRRNLDYDVIEPSKEEMKNIEDKIKSDISLGGYTCGLGKLGSPFMYGEGWRISYGRKSKDFTVRVDKIVFEPSKSLQELFWYCKNKEASDWYNKEYLPNQMKLKKEILENFLK